MGDSKPNVDNVPLRAFSKHPIRIWIEALGWLNIALFLVGLSGFFTLTVSPDWVPYFSHGRKIHQVIFQR